MDKPTEAMFNTLAAQRDELVSGYGNSLAKQAGEIVQLRELVATLQAEIATLKGEKPSEGVVDASH